VGAFVGRRRELDWLRKRLEAGARKVAVAGPPGIGKTRLVRELVRRDARPWAFVDLGSIADPGAARDCVAEALGVTLDARDPDASLARGLLERPGARLWLDGGERLPAEWLSRLAADAPDARLLLSGRRAPRWAEATLRLGPLNRDEALALWEARVRRLRPAYRVDADDRPAVDEVLARTAGHPLALELAAAETLVLGTRELARRLAAPRRGRLAGEGVLERCLRLGWEGLDRAERVVLRRCAPFEGGFTADAAEAVVGALEGRSVVSVLSALVSRSLLSSEAEGGETRLALPAVIRDEALRRLEAAGELEATARRHAFHFARLAELVPDAEPLVDRSARERLRAETRNLERAARAALDAGAPELAAGALIGLEPGWWRRGPRGEVLALLQRASAELPREQVRWHVRLAHARAVALRSRGALDEARACLEAAAGRAEAAGLSALWARCTSSLAFVHRSAGRHALAARGYERALPVFEEHGLDVALAQALTNRAVVEQDRGRSEAARRDFAHALRVLERCGRDELRPVALAGLGRLHLDAGRLPLALRTCTDAAELARQAGDDWTYADNRMAVASVELELGRFEAARTSYEAALDAFGRTDRALGAAVLAFRGMLELEAGEPAEAHSWLDRAVQAAEANGDRWTVRLARTVRALALAALAERGEAERELARAAALDAVEDPALERVEWAARRWVAGDRAPSEPPAGPASALARWADRIEARRPPSDGPRLVVHVEGLWVRLPDGTRVALDRHALLRRLLRRLATERARHPGRVVPVDALLEAGWPGEAILPGAARNRLRVALNRLRAKGLRSALESHAGGYRLRREIPFRWSAEPEPAGAIPSHSASTSPRAQAASPSDRGSSNT
jgi:tetratricopeptide (TPR) repeat protein